MSCHRVSPRGSKKWISEAVETSLHCIRGWCEKLEIWLQTTSPLLQRCDALQDGVHSSDQSQSKGTHQWNTVAGPGLAPRQSYQEGLSKNPQYVWRHLRPDGGTRYATCDEDATPHVCWVGMGWGTDNVPVDATQLTALRSNRRGQGTQHVMKMLRHMWVGWGWGGALITLLLMLRNSAVGWLLEDSWKKCFQFVNSQEVRSPCRPALAEPD